MNELRYISSMLDTERYTFPDTDGFDYGARFNFRERYIGNYLGRPLKAAHYKTMGYNKLIIEGYPQPAKRCRIVPEKSLSAPVHFDQPRYDNLGPGEHHEFFLGMYTEGIEKAHRDFPIPYDVLMQGIEDFRKGGYKNEWVQQRKLFKPFGVHATLLFDMDSKRFRARLLIERKGNLIAEYTVLEELPDELCYAFQVKELALDGHNLLVKGTHDRITYTLDLATLA